MRRPGRLLGTNRGFDARLSGGGSYGDQRRCAFLLYRQENISERTPHLWSERFFANSTMNQAARKFGVRTHTNKLVA